MKIEHIAIWTKNLEKLKDFYVRYFNAIPNKKYISYNSIGFESYFLSFQDGTRLELMYHPDLAVIENNTKIFTGFAHIAFALKSKEDVNIILNKMKNENVKIISSPRITGDGYYEASIVDFDGNIIEIIAEK